MIVMTQYSNKNTGTGANMKWREDAEEAVKKVPFFVRKKVRARVEKEALDQGKTVITLAEVNDTRTRFLSNMKNEVKGFQLDTCFGQGGCPNTCVSGDSLLERLEKLLQQEDLLGFLKKTVKGDLKFHHEVRVSLAQCPNACSQPQIKDIGIIGAQTPKVGQRECSRCLACIEACKENAVLLDDDSPSPSIDFKACISCGACIRACPTGTMEQDIKGYRVLLGGRLGRHPRLARELDGLFTENQVVDLVRACLSFYKQHSTDGKRFSVLLDDMAFDYFNSLFN